MSAKNTPSGRRRRPAAETASAHETGHPDIARFRCFIELAQEIWVELSADAHIQYVSPNVESVLGFTLGELLGESAFTHVHPEDLRHVQQEFARSSGGVTCRHRHKNGSWRWVVGVRRNFPAPDGSVRRAVVVRDVSAVKVAEEERDRLYAELVRLGKLAALGTLAGGVAHDFNNLLTGILAYTSLARSDTRQPEVAEALDHVLNASERARQLTRQIVTFSRHEQHEPLPVQLAPIVQEAMGLLRPLVPANVELRTSLAENAGVVLADSCQVHQVVLNLCSNAIHAMKPHGGRLTIELTRLGAEPAASTSAAPMPAAFVCLSVADTGRGMDDSTRQRIFEPFFTTKPRGEGTGLGLAVVERIIRDHDAMIRISSQPGVGTTFQVLFPIHTPA